MILFLTSSAFAEDRSQLNPANGFTELLRKSLPARPLRFLYITSSPDESEINDTYAGVTRDAFLTSGFLLERFDLLDRRTVHDASEWVSKADLIFLSGGHVPTQNRFFREIHLKERLSGFQGVVIGSSAGSMNAAATVYAQPELSGKAVDPRFRRRIPGLGLCAVNIIPHLQLIRNETVDGLRIIDDIAFKDSFDTPLYALPDGSFITVNGEKGRIYGEAHRIINGEMTQICEDSAVCNLY